MSDSPPPRSAQTTLPVHIAIYVLLACLLVYVLVSRYMRPAVFGERIDVEPALVAQVEQRIDPNVAGWAELARLPGVGEALAKRIVSYREEHASAGPVFRRPEDLQAIRGIGPKMTEGMRPWLKFSSPAAAE